MVVHEALRNNGYETTKKQIHPALEREGTVVTNSQPKPTGLITSPLNDNELSDLIKGIEISLLDKTQDLGLIHPALRGQKPDDSKLPT